MATFQLDERFPLPLMCTVESDKGIWALSELSSRSSIRNILKSLTLRNHRKEFSILLSHPQAI